MVASSAPDPKRWGRHKGWVAWIQKNTNTEKAKHRILRLRLAALRLAAFGSFLRLLRLRLAAF